MLITKKIVFCTLALMTVSATLYAAHIRANVAEVILTPPLEIGYTLGGYGARMSKPAEGIHDDIHAKVIVFDDGKKKYAIITMDILGLPPNVKPQVIEKLNNPAWKADNTLFLPSHAHTSLEMFALNDKNIFNNPAIGIFQPKLLEYVVDKLAEVIRMADKDLQPVTIGTLSTKIEGLNRNRRGQPFIDNNLTVTRVDKADGTPMAVLVNWTGHPTIMDERDMWVSGGWPGYLQRELEGWIDHDVVAMYFNGAEGDQSVIAYGEAGSHYEKAERYGRKMAVHAHKLYDQIHPEKDVVFEYNYTSIQLPEIGPHPDFMKTGGEEYGLDEEKIIMLLHQVTPTQTTVSALRIGDLLIVGSPGELIAELGLKVKESLQKDGIKYPVIGGLANQWVSYILSETEYEKGGYEASVSFYGKNLGDIVVKGMIDTAAPLTK